MPDWLSPSVPLRRSPLRAASTCAAAGAAPPGGGNGSAAACGQHGAGAESREPGRAERRAWPARLPSDHAAVVPECHRQAHHAPGARDRGRWARAV